MQNWLVAEICIAAMVEHCRVSTLVSRKDWAELKNFSAFYLVSIVKESLNWH